MKAEIGRIVVAFVLIVGIIGGSFYGGYRYGRYKERALMRYFAQYIDMDVFLGGKSHP